MQARSLSHTRRLGRRASSAPRSWSWAYSPSRACSHSAHRDTTQPRRRITGRRRVQQRPRWLEHHDTTPASETAKGDSARCPTTPDLANGPACRYRGGRSRVPLRQGIRRFVGGVVGGRDDDYVSRAIYSERSIRATARRSAGRSPAPRGYRRPRSRASRMMLTCDLMLDRARPGDARRPCHGHDPSGSLSARR